MLAPTWNDVTNAEMWRYASRKGEPSSGRNGIRMYCSPSSGIKIKVARTAFLQKYKNVIALL